MGFKTTSIGRSQLPISTGVPQEEAHDVKQRKGRQPKTNKPKLQFATESTRGPNVVPLANSSSVKNKSAANIFFSVTDLAVSKKEMFLSNVTGADATSKQPAPASFRLEGVTPAKTEVMPNKIKIALTKLDPKAFQGLAGATLLIALIKQVVRVLFDLQVATKKSIVKAEGSVAKTKGDATKKAIQTQFDKMKEAAEKGAKCAIITSVVLIVVSVIIAAVTLGAGTGIAAMIAVAGAAVAVSLMTAKLALEIKKKKMIDKGDLEGAKENDETIFALDMAAMAVDICSGGASGFVKASAKIAEKAAEVAIKMAVEQAAKQATKEAAKEIAQEGGKELTKEAVKKIMKKAMKKALAASVKKGATKESTEEAAKKGAEKGVKEVSKKTAKEGAKISADAVDDVVEEISEEVMEEAVERFANKLAQKATGRAQKVETLIQVTAQSGKVGQTYVQRKEMVNAQAEIDQLDVLLTILNRAINMLEAAKEQSEADIQDLIKSVVSMIKGFSGKFRETLGTISSLSQALSAEGG